LVVIKYQRERFPLYESKQGAGGNPSPIRGLPDWVSLFGSIDLCDCQECESVYAAAAYFVDLLQFLNPAVWDSSKGPRPIDVLFSRRPDLQYVELTCDNTNTPMPYVDLVDEILESYVASDLTSTLPKLPNGQPAPKESTPGITADELSANPENTDLSAYAKLKAAVFPMSLPFDLPLETARLYLEFLNSSRYEIMKTFNFNTSVQTRRSIAAEELKISLEEYEALTGLDFSGSPAAPPIQLWQAFGYASNLLPNGQAWESDIAGVPTFLAKTGVAYTDLVSLILTKFINPSRSSAQAVVLNDPSSSCDLSQTVIQHLDGSPIDDTSLQKLNRFIRLWRKLGWPIADIDKVMTALGATDITPDFLEALASVDLLRKSLQLPLVKLASFWAKIDTHSPGVYSAPLAALPAIVFPAPLNNLVSYDGASQTLFYAGPMTREDRLTLLNLSSDQNYTAAVNDIFQQSKEDSSLYRQLFQNKTVRALNAGPDPFTLKPDGSELNSTASLLDDQVPAILAALRINSADLQLIRDANGLDPASALNLSNLSVLHRYTLLPKALKISVKDFLSLKVLSGTDPFGNPDQSLQFVTMTKGMKQSHFTVQQFDYIYRHLFDPSGGLQPAKDTLFVLAKALRDGLQRIADDNVFVTDPTGEFTRKKLGMIWDSTAVDVAISLIAGTAVYSAPLAALPPIVFPPPLDEKISFDSNAKLLHYLGPMTANDHHTLLVLSGDPAYQKALSDVFQQPRDFVSINMAGFLDPVGAISILIDNQPIPPAATPPTAEDKFDYVLEGLLPYLQDRLSRSLVKQRLGEALKLEGAMSELLLETLLKSQAHPTQKSITDFLALSEGGLSGEYFPNANLTGAAVIQRVDPAMDFDWGAGTPGPGIPAHPFSVSWTGTVQPKSSENYTFYVLAEDGVRLWVDDQLLIDSWQDQTQTEHSGSIKLNAAQLYSIRLEHYNNSPAATAVLSWSSPSNPKAVVPTRVLYPETILDAYSSSYVLLLKSSLITNTLKLSAKETQSLTTYGATFGGFDLNALPLNRSNGAQVDANSVQLFGSWQTVYQFVALRNALPRSATSLLDVVGAATAVGPTIGDVETALASATGWTTTDIGDLVTNFGLGTGDFTNEAWPTRLQQCFKLGLRLGVSIDQLFQWATNPPDDAQAQQIKNTVKAQYDDDQWLTVAKPLADTLRERRKAALVAYLLPRVPLQSPPPVDSNRLFEFFLIDVDMGACVDTSRVKQAISSVQTFVQRCLMNLEDGVSPGDIDSNMWKWMKNYRVWEANRQVFLYPENWIVPELRDDKTEIFLDLQKELLQNDLTDRTAESAFLHYLEKLDRIAKLEICGMYHQYELPANGEIIDILHVFGRTPGTPHAYFYRRLVDGSSWMPWEKVNLDISGDDLIPVVMGRRLLLFWPVFTPKTVQGVSPPSVQSKGSPPAPAKCWEVTLAWSEYKDGKWLPKRTSDGFLTLGELDQEGDYDSFYYFEDTTRYQFKTFLYQRKGEPEPDLGIGLLVEDLPEGAAEVHRWFIGWFDVTGCDGKINAFINDPEYPNGPRVSSKPDNSFVDGMMFAGSDPLKLPSEAQSSSVSVLSAKDSYTLLYPHQYPDFYLEVPQPPPQYQSFFFQDDKRAYYAVPESVSEIIYQIANAEYAAPAVNIGVEATNATAAANVPLVEGMPVLATIAQPNMSSAAQAGKFMAVSAGAAATALETNVAGSKLPVGSGVAVPSGGIPTGSPFGGAESGESVGIVDVGRISDTLPALAYQYYGYPNWYYTALQVQFFSHYHAYVCEFIRGLNWKGIPGLLSLENQGWTDDPGSQQLPFVSSDPNKTIFESFYLPVGAAQPYPLQDVDFSLGSAYSIYNWEVFFHAPLMIAERLSQNLRFDDAETWFHYIFNPTDSGLDDPSSPEPAPQRYWKFLPFKTSDQDRIQDLLDALSYTGTDPATLKLRKEVQAEIDAWKKNPFDPHLIARMRTIAYQKHVVMKYLDNKIAHADQLFSQNTMENNNYAEQLYIEALDILGPRPERIPKRGFVQPETYASLQPKLDAFSNALVALENQFPFSSATPSPGTGSSGAGGGLGVASTLYFCIPQNDVLLKYWDTIDDRLYKIRHCMNIQGVVQQLPLFEPQISPALLVQAAAMGVDLSSALSDINAVTPYYRFTYMLQKALDMCNDVKALGASLLSAIEKKDAEGLALLRSTQEIALLKAVMNVKQSQLEEAGDNLDALNKSLLLAQARQFYYSSLVKINPNEQQYMNELDIANTLSEVAHGIRAGAAIAHLIPQFDIGTAGWASTPLIKAAFGGENVGTALGVAADVIEMISAAHTHAGTMASIKAGYDRRWDDWQFQLTLANKEIDQVSAQINAAKVRQTIAQTEIDNQNLQIQNSQAVDDYLRDKFSSEDLYDWMLSQVSAVYFQAYQLAYGMAKKAESAYRYERGLTTTNFVQFGNWDSVKKGLLAGEQLSLSLRQMEEAYIDQNKRDYEITKQVSLQLLDPIALITLKETGKCFFSLPEEYFDSDYPGMFMRRIKSVSLTIPCVTGPYTSINCMLTLVNNKVRVDGDAQSDYPERQDDPRFVYNFGSVQRIALSHGKNDPGVINLNFADERLLPFEMCGAISEWRLDLPKENNAFDFETISDVIMTLNYTAREGGDALRGAVAQAASAGIDRTGHKQGPSAALAVPPSETGLARMFSARHEFPDAWYQFLKSDPTASAETLTLDLTQERFPYQYRGRTISIDKVELFLKLSTDAELQAYAASGLAGALNLKVTDPNLNTYQDKLRSDVSLLSGVPHTILNVGGQPIGTWLISAADADIAAIDPSLFTVVTAKGQPHNRLNSDAIEDLYVVFHYSV